MNHATHSQVSRIVIPVDERTFTALALSYGSAAQDVTDSLHGERTLTVTASPVADVIYVLDDRLADQGDHQLTLELATRVQVAMTPDPSTDPGLGEWA